MAAVLAGGLDAKASGSRLLAWALLGSLLLHLFLLLLLPLIEGERARRAAPLPLTARLAKPPPEPPSVAPPQPPPASRTPPPLPAPVGKPAPAVAPAPAPQPVLSMDAAKPAAEPAFVVPAPPPAPPSTPAPQAKAELAPAPAAPPAAASGPDPGNMARYRLELMELASRYKRYPRIAQDNNWEGRVELRIAIGEDGSISALTVKRSSGRSVLDEEAQAMIRTAKGKVTLPPALRGKAFALEIPVEFFLKEEK